MGEGNAAVQAVGRTFFRVTIVGYVLAGVAMFPAIILGISKHYFEYKIDRCSCVIDEPCNYGADWLTVNIGWKKYTISDWNHTVGCPDAVALWMVRNRTGADRPADLDEPRSPYEFEDVYSLDGVFQRTNNPMQADESNGAAQAGDGVVAMQVVCSLLCIVTYKMLEASFFTNGSHCSIGLKLMTRINTLVVIGLVAALVSFWWLIEGRFGDANEALTQALSNTIFAECWVETTDPYDCPDRAWEFTAPGWALWCGIFQAGVYFLSTLYMTWRAPLVEGVLDGSMDKEGVVLKPRVVEVEMVVGKALATDGDPDYDSENPLYNGATTMIRPYPLPKSAKAAKAVMDEEDQEPGEGAEEEIDGGMGSQYESKDDPEMGEDQINGMHPDYNAGPDLEMIVEESEEDRTSSRYSETRYSEASRYSDTYSDYGERPARNAQGGGGGRSQMAPSR